MNEVLLLFAFVGLLLSVVGWVWFLVEAAREGIGWLLACFFCGLGQIAFLVLHFDRAAMPTLVMITGWGVAFLSTSMLDAPPM